MLRFLVTLLALTTLFCSACLNSNPSPETPQSDEKPTHDFHAVYGSPVLDGSAADDVWELCEWLPLDQLWSGSQPTPEDFAGRYKLTWDENNLYVLAEIEDDSILDNYASGLQQYWDDDCMVIYLDEDVSGGEHQYNFNAFAYHIALDGKVSSIAPDSSVRFFDGHCLSRIITRDHVSTWEIAVRIYDGKSFEVGKDNIPKLLSKGKKMGFALAYCDNDNSPQREHFMGNVSLENAKSKSPWTNASAFGLLELQ